MKGLLYKDIVVLKKQISTLLIFVVVYGGFCVAGVFDFSIIGALIAVFGLTIPMSSVAMDDTSHWDRYAAATPAGRKGIVAGKYLFTLLVILVSGLAGTVIMLGLSLAGLSDTPPVELVGISLSCATVTLLLDAILLPFLLKYGAEKARVISMITFVIIFGGAILLGGMMNNGVNMPQLPGWLAAALPVVFGLAWGPAGAWGTAIANACSDIFVSHSPLKVWLPGFFINFFFSYLPYKLWYSSRKQGAGVRPPSLESVHHILKYIYVCLMDSLVVTTFLGLLFEVLGFQAYSDSVGLLFFNNFDFAIVLGVPFILVLTNSRSMELWLPLETQDTGSGKNTR